MRLFNGMSRSEGPHNEKWYAHYSLHARSMVANASISEGKFTRDLGMFIFLACVTGTFHVFTGFARALTRALHINKPIVLPVAGRSLFFNI